MKQFVGTLISLISLLNLHAQISPCSELFISEYLEGDLLNKAVEVYNPSDLAIDLTGYTLSVYANGSADPTFVHDLSGELMPYQTYVICNNGALAPVLEVADATSDVCSFNGNDALVLAYNGVALDIIGIVGEDPLGPWAVGSGFTENFTLVRKSNVQTPTTDWSQGANEWDVFPEDTIDFIDSHDSECAGDVSVDDLTNEEQRGLVFYPNPCDVILYVEVGENIHSGLVRISDLNGKTILVASIFDNNGIASIDVSGLSSGSYLLETVADSRVQRSLLLVEKP